jgi:hypothetical protein
MLQESNFLSDCITHKTTIWLFLLDFNSIARKCSQFELFDACAFSQFAHFDDMWEHDSIDLHIKHICIFVSCFFAQYLQVAVVSLQMLIKCSNFWHLWHWLTRLFKNSVTCKAFSFIVNSFLIAVTTTALSPVEGVTMCTLYSPVACWSSKPQHCTLLGQVWSSGLRYWP